MNMFFQSWLRMELYYRWWQLDCQYTQLPVWKSMSGRTETSRRIHHVLAQPTLWCVGLQKDHRINTNNSLVGKSEESRLHHNTMWLSASVSWSMKYYVGNHTERRRGTTVSWIETNVGPKINTAPPSGLRINGVWENRKKTVEWNRLNNRWMWSTSEIVQAGKKTERGREAGVFIVETIICVVDHWLHHQETPC